MHANHFIFIDGQPKTFTGEEDHVIPNQGASTSIVLRLTAGQQVHVAPYGTITVGVPIGAGYWYSWFQATLLYVD